MYYHYYSKVWGNIHSHDNHKIQFYCYVEYKDILSLTINSLDLTFLFYLIMSMNCVTTKDTFNGYLNA